MATLTKEVVKHVYRGWVTEVTEDDDKMEILIKKRAALCKRKMEESLDKKDALKAEADAARIMAQKYKKEAQKLDPSLKLEVVPKWDHEDDPLSDDDSPLELQANESAMFDDAMREAMQEAGQE